MNVDLQIQKLKLTNPYDITSSVGHFFVVGEVETNDEKKALKLSSGSLNHEKRKSSTVEIQPKSDTE